MKKILLLFSNCFIAGCLLAQEPADALRYSWTEPGGTARQQAIGGAMGSLGGDISATFVNPAGLAFFKTGDFVVSPWFHFGNNQSTYLNRTEQDKNGGKLALGTTGFVFGSGGSGRSIRNVTFSLAINRSADFNSNILYRGENNKSSYSQKFLEEIQSNHDVDPHVVASGVGNYRFGTALALQTGWIDTLAGGSPGNYNFGTLAPIATGLLQEQTIQSSGGINELAFGAGINLNEKVMLGATLGVPLLNYQRNTSFTEADATTNTANKFNYATFSDNLNTKGAGLNLRAGVIFKAADALRLGLVFLTPTVYSLTDTYASSITTDTEGYLGVQTSTSNDADFLQNYGQYQFTYNLTTPYHVTASASYVLHEIADVTQQKGFITADVEYVNYKSASFHNNSSNDQSTTDYFNSLNAAIKNAYKGAFNFRIGGELKFTTLMVRAGAAYYGNPYQNINGENGSKMNISGGLGYRNKGVFVDLTYVQSINKDVHFPYRLENAPYYGADIKSSLGNVLMTVGFKF